MDTALRIRPRTTRVRARLVAAFAALASAGASAIAAAATRPEGAGSLPPDPLGGAGLAQLFLGLMLVLALIAVSAWLLRRFNRLHGAVGGGLKVIGGLSMGTRERLVLVQVGDTQLLIGVAPGRVQTLHVLEQPIETGAAETAPGGFAGRLQAVLRERRGA